METSKTPATNADLKSDPHLPKKFVLIFFNEIPLTMMKNFISSLKLFFFLR